MKRVLSLPLAACAADGVKGEAGGYLAVYPALYEPDMGAEFAQFPSKEYTDTYRTDVLFYGISKDGKTFEALNNNKAVMSPEGCEKLGSPSVFRKPEGGYGLIASVGNSSSKIILFDSDDLLYFTNQRIVDLNDEEIIVENPTEIDHIRKTVNASLPDYANVGEAAIFELTAEEYDRIVKKYGRLHSVAVEVEDISVDQGRKIVLPDTVNVVYSDGSKTPMGVEWDLSGIDISNLAAGEYTVKGTVTATREYNSPLASCRADPYAIYDDEKGVYYFTGSNLNERSASGGGAYSSIVIRQANRLNEITDAEEFDIWTDATLEDGTKITGWYWAPEIHKIGGKWRVIALATVTLPSEKEGGWRQCIFTCNGDDLTDKSNWEYTGYIHEGTNGEGVGAFDTTYFELNGQSYYVTPKNSSIWITTVDPERPLYPTGPVVKLSAADRAYETNNGSGKAGYNNMGDGKIGQAIQEASAVLVHGDRIFIAYAGCTIDMMYCVCLLYADVNADLMNPDSWTKYPYPILATQDLTTTLKQADYFATDGTKDVTGHGDNGLIAGAEGKYKGTFGPGHNTFTVDENGNPVIIYHARDWEDEYPGATGSNKYGLVDPGRHAYARPVIFNYEGFPVCSLMAEEYLAESLKKVEIKITVK